MENKKVVKQNNDQFESLKTLRFLMSKNDITIMLTNLQKARQSLENMNNLVRSNIVDQKANKELENKATVEEITTTTREPISNNQESNYDKPTNNGERRPLYNGTRENNSLNNRREPRPYGDRPFNSDRGFNNRSNNGGAAYTNDRPVYGSRPAYGNNRSGYSNDRPAYGNNRPGFSNDRPTYGNTRPGFSNDRPIYNKESSPYGNNSPYKRRENTPYSGSNDSTFRPQMGSRPPKSFSKPDDAPADTFLKKPERNFSAKQKKTKNFDDFNKKTLNKKAKIRMGYIVEDFGNDEDENRMGRVKSKKKREIKITEKKKFEKETITTDNLTVKILSEKIGRSVNELVKKCMDLGLMLNINSPIDFESAELVASEFGVILEKKIEKTNEEVLFEEFNQPDTEAKPRPPIVTVMGHVDHGKTSLLDAIRNTKVSAGEAGGITQHIGAYSIEANGSKITFIDTPGHEAFGSMRQRGAMVTDIAVLVVAADDGVMPQTAEAIKYIKEAGVPMIVAINKMDKLEANPDRIKQQLTEHNIVPEEWGGDTICVPLSAITQKGIDKLLETILLVAEVSDLKADPNRKGFGTVIESKIDNGKGTIANVIVKNGTLNVGDYILCGLASGRVRRMVDCRGKSVTSAVPSMAVSVLGLTDVPEAGDLMYVIDEKMAKAVISERLQRIAQEREKIKTTTSLEDFLATNIEEQKKKFYVLIKADVQGSSEAVRQTLEKLKNEEVVVESVSSGVGIVTENDILMAQASGATIIAFNTKIDAKAKQIGDKDGVIIKEFNIIYDAVDYIKEKIDAMLTPIYEEHSTGTAEVRQVFRISNIGTIAGCYVTNGAISRNDKARLVRNGEVLIDSVVETLKMQKDDVKKAKEGFECGIRLKGFNEIKESDIIQTYELVQVKRKKCNE